MDTAPDSDLFVFAGLAMLDGYVYAVGGWEGASRLDTVERYNPETNTWCQCYKTFSFVTDDEA